MSTSTPEPSPDAGATPTDVALTGPFDGLTVIITGDIEGWTRDTVHAAITKMGGKPVGSISGKTGLVIMGEGAGVSKMGKTRDHNLDVVDAETFVALAESFRSGTWDGQRVGEPIKAYDARTDPQPEPDPQTLIPFSERHLVGKAACYSTNSAGRPVRQMRQWCSCGHGWLGRSVHGEPCPVEIGVCEPQVLWPWDEPGHEPVWPPRDADAAPPEFYEALAVIEAERIAALPKTILGAPEPVAAPSPSTPSIPAEPAPEPVQDPAPTPVQPSSDPVDDDWGSGDNFAPDPDFDDFDDVDPGFDLDAWDIPHDPAEPPAATEAPAPAPAPARALRRLTTADADALLALRGNTTPAQEDKILEVALLNSPANQVHALTETTSTDSRTGTERLLSAAVLLTDGLTQAVLTDIVVAPGEDRSLADEVVGAAVATLPDHIQAIVFCRTDRTATYTSHGFEAEPGFAVMFR